MPKREPITDAQRERIERLCIEGMPRNRIAAEVGVAAGTVSKYVRDAGLSFERTSTRVATVAAQADGALANERILAGVRAGLLSTLADLERRRPKDLREVGQKARAYADLGSALAAVHRVTPVDDPEAVVIASAGAALVAMVEASKRVHAENFTLVTPA